MSKRSSYDVFRYYKYSSERKLWSFDGAFAKKHRVFRSDKIQNVDDKIYLKSRAILVLGRDGIAPAKLVYYRSAYFKNKWVPFLFARKVWKTATSWNVGQYR